ncbi:hypothetical protein [Altererythrobacter sp. MF3-039]|uniref:hypothetical protein n=1 Tax=Altererythrobacter sp. MF3-039 TaxID=3252901 RepID=UPI00390CC7A2
MCEEPGKKMSREERLAAKLRENLRRRKAQGREMANETGDCSSESDAESLSNKRSES